MSSRYKYTCRNQHELFVAIYNYFTVEGFTAADPTIPAGGAAGLEFNEFGSRTYTISKCAMHNTVTKFRVEEYDSAYEHDEEERGDAFIGIELDIMPADSTWPHDSPMRIYNTEYVVDAIDSAWWYIDHLFNGGITICYANDPDGWDRPYITCNTEGDGRMHVRASLYIYDCTED